MASALSLDAEGAGFDHQKERKNKYKILQLKMTHHRTLKVVITTNNAATATTATLTWSEIKDFTIPFILSYINNNNKYDGIYKFPRYSDICRYEHYNNQVT